jgi:hypothetical protein
MKSRKKSEVRSQKSEVKRQKAFCLKYEAGAFLLFLLIFGSCHSGTKKAEPVRQSDETGFAEFAFSEEMHNFGSLKAGEVVAFTFVFRNTGTKVLTIDKVDSGCGCTKVNIPEKSVEPGMEGRIEVIYDSAGEVGNQLKTITLYSNAKDPEKQLFIRAQVTNELLELYS